MAEKSPRRLKLEESLAADPSDSFLRYGLGVQCLREGDVEMGRSILMELIHDFPDDSIAAHQQLGQSFLETEEYETASRYLREGVLKARVRGDWHAAAEMEGLLGQLP